MEGKEKIITINEEDAFNFIIKCLREGLKRISYSNYGYDLYLTNVMKEYLITIQNVESTTKIKNTHMEMISPFFYDAAWILCRRGILRPGVSTWNKQATLEGSAGNGYSLTPFGKKWIETADLEEYLPLEPGRFAKIINKYSYKFGPGFSGRAQEAIYCYNVHAYLACCSMCGAAAESIMLSIAITKNGDEERVLKIYESAMGRSKIENFIIGQKNKYIRNKFFTYSELLKYWRDISSHGQKSDISDDEAYTSLTLLLGFTLFANDKWDDLII